MPSARVLLGAILLVAIAGGCEAGHVPPDAAAPRATDSPSADKGTGTAATDVPLAKPVAPIATPAPKAAGVPPTVPMAVAWSYSMRNFEIIPFAPIESSSPVVVDEVVYVGTARGKALYAFDAKSGVPKWTFHPQGRVESTPAIGGGRAYIATSKGELFGVALDTGAELWRATIGGVTTSHILFDDEGGTQRVIVPTGDNKVHCIDALTGAELWVYRRDPPADLTIYGTSSPVKATVVGASVYLVGFSDGTLVAIKSANGTPAWESRIVSTGRFRDVDGQVAVDDQRVYVTAVNDALHALSLDSGRVIWSAPPGGGTGVTLAGGKLFHGTDTGDVLARDPADGRELWRWHMPAGVPTTPIPGGNFLFVASSAKTLYAISAETGALAWTYEPEFRVAGAWAAPTISGNRVFLTSNVGTVFAFQPQSASTHFIGTWDSGQNRR